METDKDRLTRSDSLLPELAVREGEIVKAAELETKIETFIQEKLYKDTSEEARAGRRRAMMRAAYGEFMCAFIFYFTVLGVICHNTISGYDAATSTLISALNAGLQATAVCFAFSSVSGAHFNPSISFALWLTGKLSNRKVIVYISVQLLASVCATATVLLIFLEDNTDLYDALVIKPPGGHLGRVFATELVLTFVLTYVAFTIAFEDAEHQKKETLSVKGIAQTRGLTIYASNPQSKTGFAPFVIGFTIFSLALIGGASGGCFNQGRMFGPALLSGKWDNFHIYMFGEFCGSALAGLLVHNIHRLGLRNRQSPTDETSPSVPTLPLVDVRKV
jgi:glycerol uptake facilitator-like aquaporin